MLTWFEKHAEVVVVVLLGIVSVSTAYTSFQSSLYDSQMASAYALGNTYKTEAESMYLEANQQYVQDTQTLTALGELDVDIQQGSAEISSLAQAKYDAVWTSSVSADLADAIIWAENENSVAGDLYISPQDDEAYLDALFGPYSERVTQAEAEIKRGDEFNALGDKLTLYTVLMALSLFLLGVAAVVRAIITKVSLTALAMVIFSFAAILAALVPFVAVG